MRRRRAPPPRALQDAASALTARDPRVRASAAREVYDECAARAVAASAPDAAFTTAAQVFAHVFPLVHRLARRLDRAVAGPQDTPDDVAAVIMAVNAQGALASLFRTAQNRDVEILELDALAAPVRKRTSPSLLRALFASDMRVAIAAQHALAVLVTVDVAMHGPWMEVITAALSFRAASHADQPILLRNLLNRLSVFLQWIVRHASIAYRPGPPPSEEDLRRQSSHGIRSRRISNTLNVRPKDKDRPASPFSIRRLFSRRSSARTVVSVDAVAEAGAARSTALSQSATVPRSRPLSARIEHHFKRNSSQKSSSPAPGFRRSTTGSHPPSFATIPAPMGDGQRRVAMFRRDTATTMHIFERLLARRTTSSPSDRVQVIDALAELAAVSFSGEYAHHRNLADPKAYSEAMAAAFATHGQPIYEALLDILFRPVGDSTSGDSATDPYTSRFPASSMCLPNINCASQSALSCNALLKLLLVYVPELCSQRLALLSGTTNSAFLFSTEALKQGPTSSSWNVNQMIASVDALAVLAAVVPEDIDTALEVVTPDEEELTQIASSCVRSVCATGSRLAQNDARHSAPGLADVGVLEATHAWLGLASILPDSALAARCPAYCSSIVFLAHAARRAALITILQQGRQKRDIELRQLVSQSGGVFSSSGRMSGDGSSATRSPGVPQSPFIAEGATGDDDLDSEMLQDGGFEADDENVLSAAILKCISTIVRAHEKNSVDVMFDLYRAVVYLYGQDLQSVAFIGSFEMYQERPNSVATGREHTPGASPEPARTSQEQTRTSQEHKRASGEHTRASGEHTRTSGEHTRTSQERTRLSQDRTRTSQERGYLSSTVGSIWTSTDPSPSPESATDYCPPADEDDVGDTTSNYLSPAPDSKDKNTSSLVDVYYEDEVTPALAPAAASSSVGSTMVGASGAPAPPPSPVRQLLQSESNAQGHSQSSTTLKTGRQLPRPVPRRHLSDEDIAGLLIGNIAVDGDRASRVVRTASSALPAGVATWLHGILPPQYITQSQVSPQVTPESFRIVDTQLFEEMAAAISLVLNAVSIASLDNCEDPDDALRFVSHDVARVRSPLLTFVYARARVLVDQQQVGNKTSAWKLARYEQRICGLEAEVNQLRGLVMQISSGESLAAGADDGVRRQRARSFTRASTFTLAADSDTLRRQQSAGSPHGSHVENRRSRRSLRSFCCHEDRDDSL